MHKQHKQSRTPEAKRKPSVSQYFYIRALSEQTVARSRCKPSPHQYFQMNIRESKKPDDESKRKFEDDSSEEESHKNKKSKAVDSTDEELGSPK